MIIGSPVTFVITDEQGRRYGRDDDGNVYDEIPGLGLRITPFKKDTGDYGYILNHIAKDFDITLYPTASGTASLAALRVLPDGSAVREIYQNFPIQLDQLVTYSPDPDNMETPSITMGDGSQKTADFRSEVFVVTDTEPKGGTFVDSQYPVITVHFSKPIPEESLDDQSFRVINTDTGKNVLTSYEYDQDSKSIQFTLHEPLLPHYEYSVSIILEQVPLIDDQLDDFEYEWHFYTN